MASTGYSSRVAFAYRCRTKLVYGVRSCVINISFAYGATPELGPSSVVRVSALRSRIEALGQFPGMTEN
jgi:hypothetical protein